MTDNDLQGPRRLFNPIRIDGFRYNLKEEVRIGLKTIKRFEGFTHVAPEVLSEGASALGMKT